VVPFAEYEAFASWRQRREEEAEFWREQEEWEREWAKVPSWEQVGTWPDELTPHTQAKNSRPSVMPSGGCHLFPRKLWVEEG
jgi:hypothetical protein